MTMTDRLLNDNSYRYLCRQYKQWGYNRGTHTFRISAIVFYCSSMNRGMCPHCPLIVVLCIWYAVCLSLMAVNETNFEIDRFLSHTST